MVQPSHKSYIFKALQSAVENQHFKVKKIISDTNFFAFIFNQFFFVYFLIKKSARPFG